MTQPLLEIFEKSRGIFFGFFKIIHDRGNGRCFGAFKREHSGMRDDSGLLFDQPHKRSDKLTAIGKTVLPDERIYKADLFCR